MPRLTASKVHAPIYRVCLLQAWAVVSKNKFLWVLGFFASFLSGVGVYDVLIRGARGAISRGAFDASFYPLDSLGFKIVSVPAALLSVGGPLPFIIPAFLIVAFIIALLIWLSAASIAGSMHATAKIIKGKRVDLRDSFAAGVTHFWPVAGVSVATKLLTSALLSGLSYPVFLAVKDSGAPTTALYIALFLILVPAALTVSFLGLFASAGVVTEKQKLFPAIGIAWKQFSRHWLVSIEMALLLLGLGALVAVSALLFALVASVPFVVLAVVAGLFAGKAGASFVFMVALLLMLAFIVVVASGYTAFQIAAWTILYLRFVEKGAVAKIIRLFSILPKYLTPKRR
ncbi:hypothetical protein HYT45_02645 [Candidatus Uhrbacteria bacterium]|nr:hypothetical protein [Candidatus Uhrbacteria bacterium]